MRRSTCSGGRRLSCRSGDRRRRELLCELGPALRSSGDPTGAKAALAAANRGVGGAGDRALELRARLELEYVRLLQEPGVTAEALLETAAEAAPLFEAVHDHRSLGRTRLIAGFVEGGHLGHHRRWQESAEQALLSYRNARLADVDASRRDRGRSLLRPSTRAGRRRALRGAAHGHDAHRAGKANVLAFLGGLVAQRGELDEAREMVASAGAIFAGLGQSTAATTFCAALLGDIELLAGDAAAAERVLRDLCHELERTRDFSHLASRASDLAEAIFLQGRFDEAHEWTRVAEFHAADDDLDAQTFWRSVRAKIEARRGDVATAPAACEGGRALDRLERRPQPARESGARPRRRPPRRGPSGEAGTPRRRRFALRAEGQSSWRAALQGFLREPRLAERRAPYGEPCARLVRLQLPCFSCLGGRRCSRTRSAGPRARADRLRAPRACGTSW